MVVFWWVRVCRGLVGSIWGRILRNCEESVGYKLVVVMSVGVVWFGRCLGCFDVGWGGGESWVGVFSWEGFVEGEVLVWRSDIEEDIGCKMMV